MWNRRDLYCFWNEWDIELELRLPLRIPERIEQAGLGANWKQ